MGSPRQRFSVRAADLTLDSSLLWFGAALAIVAAFFLAYIPRLPSPDTPTNNLTGRGARVTGSSNRKLRIFAVTQIAASFLLLTGACVLMKTLYVLEQTRPPFDSSNVLALNLPVMNYGKTDAQISEFYREVKEQVSTLPGVESVSEGASVPWRGDQGSGFTLQFAAQGAHRQDGKDEYRAQFRSVSPGFFATLGVPLLSGRDFNGGDREGNERVVIISQSLANELYPGQNAVTRPGMIP